MRFWPSFEELVACMPDEEFPAWFAPFELAPVFPAGPLLPLYWSVRNKSWPGWPTSFATELAKPTDGAS